MRPDEILDLWASLRPEGTESAAYSEIVNLIFTVARLDAMRWKFDPETGKWVDDHGRPDTRPSSGGVKEIADAGRLYGHVRGAARPQPGDLKPSEQLLRDLRTDDERRAKAAADTRIRESVERNVADLASGKTRIDPDWKPGQPTVEVDLGNGKRAFVREDKAPEAAKRKHAMRDAKGHFVSAAPPSLKPPPPPSNPRIASSGPFGEIQRVTTFGEGHDPSFRPPIQQKPVTVEDILGGPSIQKPSA